LSHMRDEETINDLFEYASSKRLNEREKAALRFPDLLRQGKHAIDKNTHLNGPESCPHLHKGRFRHCSGLRSPIMVGMNSDTVG
jgi:hypothetical protein